MSKNIFFLILMLMFFGTNILAQKPIKIDDKIPKLPKEKTIKYKPPKLSVEKKIDLYLYGREVKPAIIVNNLDVNNLNGQKEIVIGDHKVIWFRADKETKIKIDDDLFSLEGQMTLNNVDENKPTEVDFANEWDQIKLFEFGERKLIGISMLNSPCTGIGCRVAMYLIYDLKTKTKFFSDHTAFCLTENSGFMISETTEVWIF